MTNGDIGLIFSALCLIAYLTSIIARDRQKEKAPLRGLNGRKREGVISTLPLPLSACGVMQTGMQSGI